MPSTATRERSLSCHYDPELTAPGQARAVVSKALFRCGLADLTEVIISELVTNAVCHGAVPVSIRIFHDHGHLHMEVHDDAQAASLAPGGRGGRIRARTNPWSRD